jgi:hypothetical protein
MGDKSRAVVTFLNRPRAAKPSSQQAPDMVNSRLISLRDTVSYQSFSETTYRLSMETGQSATLRQHVAPTCSECDVFTGITELIWVMAFDEISGAVESPGIG